MPTLVPVEQPKQAPPVSASPTAPTQVTPAPASGATPNKKKQQKQSSIASFFSSATATTPQKALSKKASPKPKQDKKGAVKEKPTLAQDLNEERRSALRDICLGRKRSLSNSPSPSKKQKESAADDGATMEASPFADSPTQEKTESPREANKSPTALPEKLCTTNDEEPVTPQRSDATTSEEKQGPREEQSSESPYQVDEAESLKDHVATSSTDPCEEAKEDEEPKATQVHESSMTEDTQATEQEDVKNESLVTETTVDSKREEANFLPNIGSLRDSLRQQASELAESLLSSNSDKKRTSDEATLTKQHAKRCKVEEEEAASPSKPSQSEFDAEPSPFASACPKPDDTATLNEAIPSRKSEITSEMTTVYEPNQPSVHENESAVLPERNENVQQTQSIPESEVEGDMSSNTAGSSDGAPTCSLQHLDKNIVPTFEAGTRLEVLWQLHGDDGVVFHWWEAEVLPKPSEGQHSALRSFLEYDAYVDGGFPDKSVEEVSFVNSRSLRAVDGTILFYRMKGDSWAPPDSQLRTATEDDDDFDDEEESVKETPAVREWKAKKVDLRLGYESKANDLWKRCSKTLPEEDFEITVPTVSSSENAQAPTDAESFPDYAVPTLAALIEGKKEPLSALAEDVTARLNSLIHCGFTTESTSTRIKTMATRKNQSVNAEIALGKSQAQKPNVYEDTSPLWRWEVSVLELLPLNDMSKVRKARAVRKKLSSHLNAVVRLIAALSKRKKYSGASLEIDKARISQEEEKVLKFEREEVKHRTAAESRLKKEQEKALAKEKRQEEKQKLEKERKLKKEEAAKEKQRLKELANKEKERQKLLAAEDKKQKKEEAAKLKQQQKEERELEKQKAKEAQQQQLQAKLDKQKNAMMSFLVAAPSPQAAPAEKVEVVADKPVADSDAFRSKIGAGESSGPAFPTLSAKARRSRRASTRNATLFVTVTVHPEDAFAQQPYSEEKEMTFNNKNKFFLFHEDLRPPYFGTWSKTSKAVTGRTPFGKDPLMDYDYDSEAEWEDTADAEMIDDDDAADLAEDRDDDEGSLEGGWLAAEDVEEMDQRRAMPVCTISPHAGIPIDIRNAENANKIEGFARDEAANLIESLVTLTAQDVNINLDPNSSNLEEAMKPSPSDDDSWMPAVLKQIHNSFVSSKDKLIEEIKLLNPSLSVSRAQLGRLLDEVAEKTKASGGECCWKVKSEVLMQNGLGMLATCDAVATLRNERMKVVAQAIHHREYSSKERAVDDMREHVESLKKVTRAECMRLIETVAMKRKVQKGGTFWEVKKKIRNDMGLDLATGIPAFAEPKAVNKVNQLQARKKPAGASPKK